MIPAGPSPPQRSLGSPGALARQRSHSAALSLRALAASLTQPRSRSALRGGGGPPPPPPPPLYFPQPHVQAHRSDPGDRARDVTVCVHAAQRTTSSAPGRLWPANSRRLKRNRVASPSSTSPQRIAASRDYVRRIPGRLQIWRKKSLLSS
jgi:hypothetical protein